MLNKILKEYKKPTITVLGQVQTKTQGAAGSTCDGAGTLGTGSKSNANACTS